MPDTAKLVFGDLPTSVPLDPDANLSALDNAKILAAPGGIADADRWRRGRIGGEMMRTGAVYDVGGGD